MTRTFKRPPNDARMPGRRWMAASALLVSLLIGSTGALGLPNHDADWSRADIAALVVREAVTEGTVPPALALAVARVESNMQARVESYAGARGVMQIMPATARDVFGVSADRLWDPGVNVPLGVAYLSQLYYQYGERWDLALSHYNGGSLKRSAGRFLAHTYTRRYVADVTWWQRYYENNIDTAQVIRDARGEPRFATTGLAVQHRDGSLARYADDIRRLYDPRADLGWQGYLRIADDYLKDHGRGRPVTGQPGPTRLPRSSMRATRFGAGWHAITGADRFR